MSGKRKREVSKMVERLGAMICHAEDRATLGHLAEQCHRLLALVSTKVIAGEKEMEEEQLAQVIETVVYGVFDFIQEICAGFGMVAPGDDVLGATGFAKRLTKLTVGNTTTDERIALFPSPYCHRWA